MTKRRDDASGSNVGRTGATAEWRGGTPRLREVARGTVFDRYVVLEPLGFGGMGQVFAAYDPDLDRKVAVKLLHDVEGAGGGGGSRERLLREAQAMARLSHPNVVAVHDVGTVGDAVFVAMELLPGQSLRQWIAAQPATASGWRRVLQVFVEAGRGLAAAHDAGLIHRDFKPENVMVLDDGRVKVLDFGLARPTTAHAPPEEAVPLAVAHVPVGDPSGSRLATPLTLPGAIVGTPGYMAPEQLTGETPGPAADQFAFCVALWEALLGERPFAGATLVERLNEIEAGRLRRVPADARVPRHVVRALQRGLSARPADRFATMADLLAELERDPERTRRRRLAWLAAAAAATAVTVWVWQARSPPASPCAAPQERLAGVWDAPTRSAVEAALLATGRSYASRLWARLEGRLDDYAARWAMQYTEACEATFVRGEQSEELLDLRMFCLNDRLGELRALTELLRRADDVVLERAERSSQNLSDLAACADVERLRERMPLPTGEQRRRLEELAARLAPAEALLGAGKFAGGLAVAEPVAHAASELGYAPFTAEALLVLGRLQMGAGRYRDGAASLREALWLAEEGRHDEVAVRAAIALVALEGNLLAQFERGQDWARQARAVLVRHGGHAELEAELDEQVGAMLRYRGHWTEALERYRTALATRERLYGADDPRSAAALRGLAAALRFEGRSEEAAAHLERALALQRAALGGDHPEVAVTLEVLSGVHRDRGDYATAHEVVGNALAIAERALGTDHPEVARFYSGLGAILESWGRYSDGLEANRRALAIRERVLPPEHPDLGVSLNNLAVTLLRLGQPADALPYHQRALAIFERALGPDHLWVGHPLWGVGTDQLELGQPRLAIPHLERGLAIREAREVDPGERAEMRHALARALWESGVDPARARRLMLEAASELRLVAGRDMEREEVERWLDHHDRSAPDTGR